MASTVETPRILLKDRAYEALKELILQEVFPPGSFLSERQLATRLEMSKTPIRAALERLETEGLVSVSPQQGILVRETSVHEVVDIFDVRIALERFAMHRIAGMLSPAQQLQVQENLDAQKKALEEGDVPVFTELDADFHLMLCGFLGNREVVQVMRRLRDRLYRIALQVLLHDVGRIRSSYDEHKKILDMLIQGDGVSAADLVESHLVYGKQVLISR
ncbi:MAG: GntR family transcriptional regulator [Candidatus Latescibacterota bacterium]|jgi:DNA-binding GntR family transcriptional regulator